MIFRIVFFKKSLVFKLCHLMYYLHQHKKKSVLLGCYVMPSAFYLQWKRGFVEAFMVITKSWIKALDFKHLDYLCFVSSFLVNFYFGDGLSCVPAWLHILCVAKDDLELLIFLLYLLSLGITGCSTVPGLCSTEVWTQGFMPS